MTVRAFSVRSSDLDRCPIRSISPAHYTVGPDGAVSCACRSPQRPQRSRRWLRRSAGPVAGIFGIGALVAGLWFLGASNNGPVPAERFTPPAYTCAQQYASVPGAASTLHPCPPTVP